MFSKQLLALFSNLEQRSLVMLNCWKPKYEWKKLAKLGTLLVGASNPGTLVGFGGANRIGVIIANFFMSGCCRYPMELIQEPLKGWPAVKRGWA